MAYSASRAADVGVCSGVSGCTVVAKRDVNGDGRLDPIGLARRGAKGAANGAVLVRVKIAAGRIVSKRFDTSYYYGPLWAGAARLDGRTGADLVIGQSSGAHTIFYRAVTWRDGELVTLSAPGTATFWAVDAAYSVSIGWLQRSDDPAGRLTSRAAQRGSNGWKGTVTTYQWVPGGWDRLSSRTVQPLAQRTAYSWAGFHVPGLKRGLG